MYVNEIDHLINILRNKDIGFNKKDKDNILNNLVYYVPRIKDNTQLKLVIYSLFHIDNVTLLDDPFQLQEIAQSIFLSKLSISEPTLPISMFYKIWDSVICNMENRWTLPNLAMLSGILITKDVYESLQNTFYIDDHIGTQSLYTKWRERYFIPVFVNAINTIVRASSRNSRITQREDLVDYLVSLYSTVAYSMDSTNNNDNKKLPWDLITESSISIIIKYMTGTSKYPAFLNKRINCIALNLQNCIPHTDLKTIKEGLVNLNYHCKLLSNSQQYGDTPNKSYSDRFFSNILLSIILTFKSILTSKSSRILRDGTPLSESDTLIQFLESLFYLHFITMDFGVIGFQSYEMIYDILCAEIVRRSNNDPSKQYYNSVLQRLLSVGIRRDLRYPNKVNDSKMIFLLDFIKNTVPSICPSDLKSVVRSVIEPLIMNETLNSPYLDIRESSHSVVIELLSMVTTTTTTDAEIQRWQLSNILPYMNRSFDQHIMKLISKEQLYIIVQRLGGSVQVLSIYKHDFQREWLQNMYRRLMDLNIDESMTKVEMIQLRTTLLECIIFQIPYINSKYLTDWLENIEELAKTLLIDDCHYNEIIDTLWNVISESKSDIAIKWWYSRGLNNMPQAHL